jgi:hypothetical protein
MSNWLRTEMKMQIEELWDVVSAQTNEPNIFRRVDEHHPLDLYAGIDRDGHRVLLLVTELAPEDLPTAGAVEVVVQQREDAEWAVLLRLARPELSELFGRLCQDLVDTTRTATKPEGAALLMNRLQRWRRLLEPRHERSLSEREVRGLLGELWVLDTLVIPRVGPVIGIQAWLGPLDAPQDFLVNGSLVEVKTVQPGAHTIPISSAGQLDASTPLFVGVVTLSAADESAVGAFTPALLLARIRARIDTSDVAINELALRLADVGYDERAAYAKQWYLVLNTAYYRVSEGFPRLTSNNLPSGVTNVTYELGIDAIKPYEASV